jgi:hypothetical protein
MEEQNMMKNYLSRIKNTNKEFLLRYMTSFIRTKPNLIIIGAQKAGTTSLYNYLVKHPDIYPASIPYSNLKKEIHYYTLYPKKSQFWYRSHFPTLLTVINQWIKRKPYIAIESTPYYLFHPVAAQRMNLVTPNVKIIILLRNPIDRFISHYMHNKRAGREPLTMEQAINTYPDKIDLISKKITYIRNYANVEHGFRSYVERGFYAEQIKRYLNLFPKNNIRFYCSEEMFKNPNKVLSDIFQFIEVDDIAVDAKEIYNQGNKAKENFRDIRNKLRPIYDKKIKSYMNF